MMADFRSSVLILFLGWENLKPKLVFSKNKDIFQCRVESSFSHETSMGGVCILVEGSRLYFRLF